MKVAYLGKVQLTDIDLSYLNEARRLNDVTYIIEVNPRFMQGPACDIKSLYPRSGIFRATEAYPQFGRLSGFIDTEKFYVVNTTGRLWVLKSFWTHLQLLFFLLRQRFDVVHLVWPPNLYEMVLYALRRRMVLTVHDPFVHTGNDTFIVRLRRHVAFRLVPRLVILNATQREAFISHYRLRAERVTASFLSAYTYLTAIHPQALPKEGGRGSEDGNPDRPEVEEEDLRAGTGPAPTLAGEPPELPLQVGSGPAPTLAGSYILFAGKILPYKGLDYLLPAMVQVHAMSPDCRLVVAGGGRFSFDVSPYERLSYIDIRNRFIPEEELVGLIAGARFVVCPYTDATQSGVVMSAFAFGKPVVATRVGALPETVVDGRHGIIVREKDSAALAEAIARLWEQEDTLAEYARNIHADYATGEHSWRAAAVQLSSLYHSVAGVAGDNKAIA